MKIVIYTLLAGLLMLTFGQDACATQWKKKKKQATAIEQQPPRKQPTAYERLFQGKQVVTKNGLMKIHACKDHGKDLIYVEFPVKLLGKDMMLTSSIEEISDAGEGAVGQVNNFVQLRMTRQDSNLLVRLVAGDEPQATVAQEGIREAMQKATQPGIWQMLKILAFTPDSNALVVDMTRIFMEHTDYTSPFAAFGGNSMGGFSQRIQRPRPDKTLFKGIEAYPKSILVTGEYHYFVDHKFMGQQTFRQNVPVTVVANRILMLLPEQPMRPRLADMRVGVTLLNKTDIQEENQGFKTQPYCMRWRLEPTDWEKYNRGELVEPVKPIVFYMDTLMPADWKKAIADAAEAWNPAFEQIGFKNVIKVVDFPRNDPSFHANNLEYNTIRYATTWVTSAQNSVHADLRSGEILNTTVIVHNGIGVMLSDSYRSGTLGLDPAARTNGMLPENIRYELMKAYMMPIFGNTLGLTSNPKALSAFPLDSLRSPAFTQKYGIAPSVMTSFRFNVIAQPEDVAKGVRLLPKGPGECDYFTIKWLYSPIPGAKTAAEEKAVLEKWVAAQEGNRNCLFNNTNRLMSDATYASRVPGDDQFRAVQLYLKNVKRFFEHADEWYKDGDGDYSKRAGYILGHAAEVPMVLRIMANYIGGFSINYTQQGVHFDFVPKQRQKEVLHYCLEFLKDISWIDAKSFEKKAGLIDNQSSLLTRGFLNHLVSKVEQLFFCEEHNKGGYTSQEFAEDFYQEVWKPTQERRPLTEMEKLLQQAFLGCLLSSSGIMPAPKTPGTMAPPVQKIPSQGLNQAGQIFAYQEWNRNTLYQQDQEMLTTEQRSELFVPVLSSLKVSRYPVQHWYYNMVLKTKTLVQNAIPKSSGETKMHYEYLLKKMNDILDID